MLINKIVNENIFKMEDFWRDFLKYNLTIYFNLNEGDNKSTPECIAFSAIINVVTTMTMLLVNRDVIIKLISPFIKEYKLLDCQIETIYMAIPKK